ncbi:MAG: MarR family transcriptional regulator [Erysipelotrichaceae bacterium]|nr:MarR family transcriptional regulator [Erysipelotrichaceae bacterium]
MEQTEIMEQILRLSRATKRKPSKDKSHERGRKSFSQRRLVHYVLKNPGCMTSELTTMMDLRPSSMTELLDNLEREGDIIRKKDENDNRVTLIYPTAELIEKTRKKKEERDKSSYDLENVLDEDEKKEFIRLSNKIIDFLSNEGNKI